MTQSWKPSMAVLLVIIATCVIATLVRVQVAHEASLDYTRMAIVATIVTIMVAWVAYEFCNRRFGYLAIFVPITAIGAESFSLYYFAYDSDQALEALIVGPLYFLVIVGEGILVGRLAYKLLHREPSVTSIDFQ